jgi:hypothetical protein
VIVNCKGNFVYSSMMVVYVYVCVHSDVYVSIYTDTIGNTSTCEDDQSSVKDCQSMVLHVIVSDIIVTNPLLKDNDGIRNSSDDSGQ